jgi:hypothetical protein
MRWTRLAAILVLVGSAAEGLAEMPDFSANRPQIFQGGRLVGGQGWWARFGEPVNATAMAQAEASPSDKLPSGPMPMYGDGYVYGPGTCDCSPPCISHLWAGYYQNPKRCHPHQWGNRGCGAYNACGCGCNTGLFAKDCCNTCGGTGSCSCAAPVTCTTAAPDCSCKPVCGKCRHCHVGHRFLAHWNCGCSSCATPVGCGCATPAAPFSEKQASSGPPVPLPEEAVLYTLPRLN